MSVDDEPTIEELAAVAAERRIPERHELGALLQRYFIGPIHPDTIDRLAAQFFSLIADASRRRPEGAAFRANGRRYLGQAWKEELSLHDNLPSPEELAVWLVVVTQGYPAPRPYCPERFVGTWRAREPRAALWKLGADGRLECNDDVLGTRTTWCIHRAEGHVDFRGDELWLSSPVHGTPTKLFIELVTPTSMKMWRAEFDGPVDFELERVVRARTITEMKFAAALEPCVRCGTHQLPKPFDLYGQDDTWMLVGPCPACDEKRPFSFFTYGAPYEGAHAPYELGQGPSELISAAQFQAELERVRAGIMETPTELAPPAWHASLDAIRVALIALTELTKLAAGTERETFEAERAHVMAIAKRYTADAERIYAIEHP